MTACAQDRLVDVDVVQASAAVRAPAGADKTCRAYHGQVEATESRYEGGPRGSDTGPAPVR